MNAKCKVIAKITPVMEAHNLQPCAFVGMSLPEQRKPLLRLEDRTKLTGDEQKVRVGNNQEMVQSQKILLQNQGWKTKLTIRYLYLENIS